MSETGEKPPQSPPPEAAKPPGAAAAGPPGAKPPAPAGGPPGGPPPKPAVAKQAPGVRSAKQAPAGGATLRTGDTVGGIFRVERYLGASGGGVSYLCKNEKTAESLVIKVLDLGEADEERFAALRDEVRLASTIQHPNLTKIQGMGRTGKGEPFVAMEFVNGSTLSSLVARLRENGHRVDLRDAFSLLAHVCDALDEVHSKMAHGVLTPYNIYVSRQGVPKVGNLAFGHFVSALMLETHGEGPYVDSIYVAPEVTNDPDDISPQADMFSLGMLAAELMSPEGLPNDRWSAKRDALDAFGDAPPSLVNLIASCIDPEPANRPRSAAEFRATFEDAAREAGAKLGAPPREHGLPVKAAVAEDVVEDSDDDLFDIPEISGMMADADEGEERYLVQRDGLDYGPFTHGQVLEQLHADDIDEFTPILDRVTQERIPLGEMDAFAEEVAEYLPVREERRRQEAARRAELERKVKQGGKAALVVGVIVAGIVAAAMAVYYFSLPEPEEMPLEAAFVGLDYKFLPPPKEFEQVAVDSDLLASIFNPRASEEEIARKIRKRSRRRPSGGKKGGGGNGNVAEVDLSGTGTSKHLSDYEINQIIMSDFGSLRSCIMKEFKSGNTGFKGVTVQFFVRPSGTTGGVKIQESKYADRPVGQCLVQRFRRMKFPEHGAISNKGVTFPLRVQ